jgi:predicted nucleic acid-binding protein
MALPDITAAAVVLANGFTLVTDNRKHFPMPEMQLLSVAEHSRKGTDGL